MANGNSRAARSARAKRQLRDSKGRWIEMGRSRLTWYSSKEGRNLSGTAIEGSDKDVIVQTDDGKKHAVSTSKVQIIDHKFTLPTKDNEGGRTQPQTPENDSREVDTSEQDSSPAEERTEPEETAPESETTPEQEESEETAPEQEEQEQEEAPQEAEPITEVPEHLEDQVLVNPAQKYDSEYNTGDKNADGTHYKRGSKSAYSVAEVDNYPEEFKPMVNSEGDVFGAGFHVFDKNTGDRLEIFAPRKYGVQNPEGVYNAYNYDSVAYGGPDAKMNWDKDELTTTPPEGKKWDTENPIDLSNATTTKDVEDALKEKFPTLTVDLGLLEPEKARLVAEAFDENVRTYPHTSKVIGKFFAAKKSGAAAWVSHMIDQRNKRPVELGVSATETKEDALRAYAQDRFLSVADYEGQEENPFKATIDHEFGHINEEYANVLNQGEYTQSKVADEFDAYLDTLNPQMNKKQRGKNGLSEYGMMNPAETIAESFAERRAYGDDARAFSKYVTGVMSQWAPELKDVFGEPQTLEEAVRDRDNANIEKTKGYIAPEELTDNVLDGLPNGTILNGTEGSWLKRDGGWYAFSNDTPVKNKNIQSAWKGAKQPQNRFTLDRTEKNGRRNNGIYVDQEILKDLEPGEKIYTGYLDFEVTEDGGLRKFRSDNPSYEPREAFPEELIDIIALTLTDGEEVRREKASNNEETVEEPVAEEEEDTTPEDVEEPTRTENKSEVRKDIPGAELPEFWEPEASLFGEPGTVEKEPMPKLVPGRGRNPMHRTYYDANGNAMRQGQTVRNKETGALVTLGKSKTDTHSEYFDADDNFMGMIDVSKLESISGKSDEMIFEEPDDWQDISFDEDDLEPGEINKNNLYSGFFRDEPVGSVVRSNLGMEYEYLGDDQWRQPNGNVIDSSDLVARMSNDIHSRYFLDPPSSDSGTEREESQGENASEPEEIDLDSEPTEEGSDDTEINPESIEVVEEPEELTPERIKEIEERVAQERREAYENGTGSYTVPRSDSAISSVEDIKRSDKYDYAFTNDRGENITPGLKLWDKEGNQVFLDEPIGKGNDYIETIDSGAYSDAVLDIMGDSSLTGEEKAEKFAELEMSDFSVRVNLNDLTTTPPEGSQWDTDNEIDLSGANTLADVRAVMGRKYPGLHVEFEDANIEDVKEAVGAFDANVRRFPFLSRALTRFEGYNDPSSSTNASIAFHPDLFGTDGAGFRINMGHTAKSYREAENLSKEGDWFVGDKFSSGDNAYQNTVDHEFGHLLEYYAKFNDDSYTQSKVMDKVDEYLDTFNTGNSSARTLLREELSEYGTTNGAELIAEATAEKSAQGDDARPISDIAMSVLAESVPEMRNAYDNIRSADDVIRERMDRINSVDRTTLPGSDMSERYMEGLPVGSTVISDSGSSFTKQSNGTWKNAMKDKEFQNSDVAQAIGISARVSGRTGQGNDWFVAKGMLEGLEPGDKVSADGREYTYTGRKFDSEGWNDERGRVVYPDDLYKAIMRDPSASIVREDDEPEEAVDTTPEDEVASTDVDETKVPGTDIDRTEPTTLEGEKYPPTRQQQDVIDAVMAGEDTLVQAKAGAGKTSTLEAISRRIKAFRDNEQILYIAFNRSVQQEAKGRMPDNVEARTGHSLAFQWAPEWMQERMGGGSRRKGSKERGKKRQAEALRRPDDIADHLEITEGIDIPGEDKSLDREEIAMNAVRTVDRYAYSADDEVGPQHLPEAMQGLPEEAQDVILDAARKVWADLSDENGKLKFTFDHSRKHWALTRPDLSNPEGGYAKPAKVIFLDEAQDTPPVLAKVVADQNVQKVIVGDADQAIYGFTGAVDFLSTADADVELPLNKSWRFGPQVADAGNRFLQMLGSKGRVVGGGPESSITPDGERMANADAILTRSNAGMIGEIAKELDAGRTVGVPSGTKADMQRLFNHANDLLNGRTPRNIHEDLAPFRTWKDFQKEVAKDEDPKLKMINTLIDDHGGVEPILALIDKVIDPGESGNVQGGDPMQGAVIDPNTGAISKAFMFNKNLKAAGGSMYNAGYRWNDSDKTWVPIKKTPEDIAKAVKAIQEEAERVFGAPTKPDVVISTAHKAKGLEWGRVRIGDDFQGPKEDKNIEGLIHMPEPEEFRLAYVAVTRAETELDPGSLRWVYDYTDEDGGVPEEAENKADPIANPTEDDDPTPEQIEDETDSEAEPGPDAEEEILVEDLEEETIDDVVEGPVTKASNDFTDGDFDDALDGTGFYGDNETPIAIKRDGTWITPRGKEVDNKYLKDTMGMFFEGTLRPDDPEFPERAPAPEPERYTPATLGEGMDPLPAGIIDGSDPDLAIKLDNTPIGSVIRTPDTERNRTQYIYRKTNQGDWEVAQVTVAGRNRPFNAEDYETRSSDVFAEHIAGSPNNYYLGLPRRAESEPTTQEPTPESEPDPAEEVVPGNTPSPSVGDTISSTDLTDEVLDSLPDGIVFRDENGGYVGFKMHGNVRATGVPVYSRDGGYDKEGNYNKLRENPSVILDSQPVDPQDIQIPTPYVDADGNVHYTTPISNGESVGKLNPKYKAMTFRRDNRGYWSVSEHTSLAHAIRQESKDRDRYDYVKSIAIEDHSEQIPETQPEPTSPSVTDSDTSSFLQVGDVIEGTEITPEQIASMPEGGTLVDEDGTAWLKVWNGELAHPWSTGRVPTTPEKAIEDYKDRWGRLTFHIDNTDPSDIEIPKATREGNTIFIQFPDGSAQSRSDLSGAFQYAVVGRLKESGSWSARFSKTEDAARKQASFRSHVFDYVEVAEVENSSDDQTPGIPSDPVPESEPVQETTPETETTPEPEPVQEPTPEPEPEAPSAPEPKTYRIPSDRINENTLDLAEEGAGVYNDRNQALAWKRDGKWYTRNGREVTKKQIVDVIKQGEYGIFIFNDPNAPKPGQAPTGGQPTAPRTGTPGSTVPRVTGTPNSATKTQNPAQGRGRPSVTRTFFDADGNGYSNEDYVTDTRNGKELRVIGGVTDGSVRVFDPEKDSERTIQTKHLKFLRQGENSGTLDQNDTRNEVVPEPEEPRVRTQVGEDGRGRYFIAANGQKIYYDMEVSFTKKGQTFQGKVGYIAPNGTVKVYLGPDYTSYRQIQAHRLKGISN